MTFLAVAVRYAPEAYTCSFGNPVLRVPSITIMSFGRSSRSTATVAYFHSVNFRTTEATRPIPGLLPPTVILGSVALNVRSAGSGRNGATSLIKGKREVSYHASPFSNFVVIKQRNSI